MKFCGSCGARLGAASPPGAQGEAGERRQLTVLFSDLVGSTPLSARLDPEDWRAVVRAYQQAATEVVTRFEGHVAQHLGDGLLVYFGYPQAHEDDAERAVRAGLAIVEAMRTLNERLEPAHGVRLALRVGMHTGPVVVDEAGEVFGETPNVAARVQAMAAPDTVVITGTTHRMVSGWFVVEDGGRQALKGIPEPVQVYRVLQASVVRSRLAARAHAGLTPFVGREDERRLLVDRWARARGGEGQVVLITGEPGIGKSRLVHTLKEALAGEPHTWTECSSSPYHQNTPFHAVVEMLQQGLAWRGDEGVSERLEALERSLALSVLPLPEALPLLAPLLGLPVPERYPRLGLSPEAQRRRTFSTLAAWLFGAARVQPVVLVVEDLHWADPSTLELQGLLTEQVATAPVLILYTARPEFQVPWPLLAHHAQVALNRLSGRQVREVVGHLAGGRVLSNELVETLVARTDGVPLFVEELTRALVESDSGAARTVPGSLHDSLIARLDRLGAAKEIAQMGAVIGRTFDYAIISRIARLEDAALRDALTELENSGLAFRRGARPNARFTFKHALVQETAYGSLLRSRRSELHGRVAACLEAEFPEIVETEPELLARHHTEAGNPGRAIAYWKLAGQHAQQRSAIREAIEHLGRGLDLVPSLDAEAERNRAELDLQVALGPALQVAHGFGSPIAERSLGRALELCRVLGDADELFPVLWGYWFLHNSRLEFPKARQLVQELFALARESNDPAFLLEAHHAAWGGPFVGNFIEQLEHAERGLAIYNPAQHATLAVGYGGHDPGVCALQHRAVAQYALGFADEAQRSMDQAAAWAENGPHLPTRLHARLMTALSAFFRADTDSVLQITEQAIEQANRQGFPALLPWFTVLGGWAEAVGRGNSGGLDEIARGLELARRSDSMAGSPTLHAIQADAVGRLRSPVEGIRLVDEALDLFERFEERMWEANAHTLKGELLLAQSDRLGEHAERCFHRAIDIARRQQARMWELRAATHLACLWHSQGKTSEARDLLAPVYGWFTEGFDTRDLVEAKALLEELG